MPVHERENVFNEWGAVIKHQDEIDQELRRIQQAKMRERQKNYKLQLDQQYREYMDKKKGALSDQARKEDAILKAYQKDLDDKNRKEDEKRSQVMNNAKTAAFESMNEMNIMKKQQKQMNDMEQQIYHNKMKMQEEIDNQKRLEQKEKAKSEQMNYSKILALQHKSKIDQANYEKIADRQFSEAERIKLNKEEDQRKNFFDKLNRIQERNDIKQKKLQEYMEQDPKELRSKQDEKNYLRNLELAEKKGIQKEHDEKNKKQKDQISNYNSLAQQLKEKEFYQQNLRMQENAIAKHYNQEANKYREEVQEEKRKKEQAKSEYYNALTNQISQNKKKKQYSVLMTEHERRVNDKDIKAYEYQDTHNLYSKVPGFGGDNRLEKYIDKSMNIEGQSQGSPIKPSEPSKLDVTSEKGSHLAQMGKMSLNRSTNILADGEEEPSRYNNAGHNAQKLLKVRENMEKQDAIKYRANTNNRGYGFDQRMGHNPPTNKVFPARDDTNPYEYNFVAPGNY